MEALWLNLLQAVLMIVLGGLAGLWLLFKLQRPECLVDYLRTQRSAAALVRKHGLSEATRLVRQSVIPGALAGVVIVMVWGAWNLVQVLRAWPG
jgi:hypothetical protein